MGTCESNKNTNGKIIIQSEQIKNSKIQNPISYPLESKKTKESLNKKSQIENSPNNNNIKEENIQNKENFPKKENPEKKENSLLNKNTSPELPLLRRPQRLKSEYLIHPDFKFLSDKKNEEEEKEDKFPNDININNIDRKKYNNTPIFHTIKNTSLSFQRKQSQKYCKDFKRKTTTGGKYLLNHLANTLIRNSFGEQKPKNYKYYTPEFTIDWRYVKNENTDLYIWKNFGQIPLTQELINSIIFGNEDSIIFLTFCL